MIELSSPLLSSPLLSSHNMADGGRRPDDTPDDDYVNVDDVPPEINGDPSTVNVSSTNIYARKYNVYNIDAKNVQIYQNPEPGPNTPPSFNSLHGIEVVLEKENTIARRTKGFKNGICFANKPFAKDSAVHFGIKDTFENAYGRCRMGFTNRDPNSLAGSGILKKGLETARSSNGFVIMEPSMDTCAYPGAVVYFSYADDQVSFRSSKDGAIQTFPCPYVFQKSDNLWAFIELRGSVKAVEVENNDFHEVCGTLALVSENTASQSWWYSMGVSGGLVCFTKHQVAHGKHVEFKLSQVYMNSAGHIRVGICKENPDLIRPENLPRTVLKDEQYTTIEIGAEDAVSGNIVSLVPVESQICVTVNGDKQIGIINLDKPIEETWAVVELFGKTKGVEILSQPPNSDTPIGSTAQNHIERVRAPVIDQQLSSVADLWLESQVVMNTLKVMADAVFYHIGGTCAGSYWNSAVNTVETAASYFGLGTYVQMAEVGDAPEILRTEGPTLAISVESFVSHIDGVKALIGQLDSSKISPGQEKQFKLLRSIAAALPKFDIQLPQKHPASPPPTSMLLNLSPLPVDADILQSWYRQVVAKTLLDTANKIEAAFAPLDIKIRQLYTYGI